MELLINKPLGGCGPRNIKQVPEVGLLLRLPPFSLKISLEPMQPRGALVLENRVIDQLIHLINTYGTWIEICNVYVNNNHINVSIISRFCDWLCLHSKINYVGYKVVSQPCSQSYQNLELHFRRCHEKLIIFVSKLALSSNL